MPSSFSSDEISASWPWSSLVARLHSMAWLLPARVGLRDAFPRRPGDKQLTIRRELPSAYLPYPSGSGFSVSPTAVNEFATSSNS